MWEKREKSRPQRLWEFLSTRSNWTKISALSTVVAVILLRLLARFGIAGIADSQLLLGVAIALGLLISTLLVEQPEQLSRIDDQISSVSRAVDDALALVLRPQELSGFFKRRDLIKNYPRYVDDAREEIFAVGLTLAHFAVHRKELVRDKVTKGCRVRFLLPSLQDEGGMANPLVRLIETHFAEPEYGSFLESSVRSLQRLQREMDEGKGHGLEVRLYTDALPTLGFTIVDPQSPNGKVLVELYPYRCSPEKRPSFELRRREEEGLFDAICTHCDMLWQDSAPKEEAESPGT